MRFLTNGDVEALLDPGVVLDALRVGYAEFREGGAAQIPRADLIAPAASGTHRLGVMAGVSRAFDTAVVRIKSDVVAWGEGTEEKHASRPGRFSGTVIAFRVSDGAPRAIVQDGVIQHMRVGGAAALGTAMLAPPMRRLAVVGSGGMARAITAALAAMRMLPTDVAVYSRNPNRRSSFASHLRESFGVDAADASTARYAVTGADVVITATNSLNPTIDPEWLGSNSHVTAVSRREVGEELQRDAGLVACLGPSSYPADLVPGMTLTRGGYGAFIAASERELGEMPSPQSSDASGMWNLMVDGAPWAERPEPMRSILVAVGTQGIQFASTVGRLLAIADAADTGTEIPDDLFLHEVRN